MKTLNHPATALLSLLTFLWLGWYSQQAEIGYTASQRAGMARLVASSMSKPASGIRQRQASAIKDIWQLTDNDAAAPVELFGGHEHE